MGNRKQGQEAWQGALQRSLCARHEAGWVVWECGWPGYLSCVLSVTVINSMTPNNLLRKGFISSHHCGKFEQEVQQGRRLKQKPWRNVVH